MSAENIGLWLNVSFIDAEGATSTSWIRNLHSSAEKLFSKNLELSRMPWLAPSLPIPAPRFSEYDEPEARQADFCDAEASLPLAKLLKLAFGFRSQFRSAEWVSFVLMSVRFGSIVLRVPF